MTPFILCEVTAYAATSLFRPANWLDNATGCFVESKRGRSRIATAPGAIEARLRTQRTARRYRSVVRNIRDGYRTPALRICAIPELRNRLPIGKREVQAPTINRTRSCIGNRKTGTKTGAPLVRNRVMHA